MPRKSTSRTAIKSGAVPTGEVTNKIPLDDLIKVVSLLDYPLVLLDGGNGNSKYKFTKFGESKLIIYQDVLRIMEEKRSFMEKGFFVIMDERVINRHGLQELLRKVLTKESILKILEGSDEALSLYNVASDSQKQNIIGMITRKLIDNPDSIDLNVVSKISRASGVDIIANADEARKNFEERGAR